ncbi:superoxide dismutase [Patescibacteria group bacterium]|nr:MAG: superoxide dismutase [Patescibacteria group bacterium]
MPYTAKQFANLSGVPGLSEQLVANHLTLYQGYVTNANKLLEILDAKEPGTVEYSELQRRLGWEWNGMRLHELYFENLSAESTSLAEGGQLKSEIDRIYGSLESWQKNFAAVGAMRGIGWVVLYYDPEAKELFNTWITEHDGGHLAGAVPLLVMDVFEHAYMLDYQLKRADYIAAFMKAIDWKMVSGRFTGA